MTNKELTLDYINAIFDDMFESYKSELNVLSNTAVKFLHSLYRASWAYEVCLDNELSDPHKKTLQTALDERIDKLVEHEACLHNYFLETINEIKNRPE